MQHEITDCKDWLMMDGICGVECVPLEITGLDEKTVLEVQEKYSCADGDMPENIGQFYSGGASGICSVTVVNGFGCRLSAPGYLDCTDWTVFGTPEECKNFLEEAYGDEYAD